MIQLQNKLIKKSDSTVLFTLNFTDILDEATLATIDSYSIISNGIDLDDIDINSTQITVDDETIEIGKAVQVLLSSGVENNEYLLTLGLTDSDDETIDVSCIVFITKFNIDYYGAAYYADDYFALRLNSDVWDDATLENKIKALMTATKTIDRLNFTGAKSVSDQKLEFPRIVDDESIGTPTNVLYATYELAYEYLNGADQESENKNVNIIRNQFDKVSTTYDRSFVQEHLRNGIPSIVAWNYLIPYLRDVRRVDLHRVN